MYNYMSKTTTTNLNTALSKLITADDEATYKFSVPAPPVLLTLNHYPTYGSAESASVYFTIKNVSGSSYVLTDFNLYLHFRSDTGGWIAKPSTSYVWNADIDDEVNVPDVSGAGAIVGNNETLTFHYHFDDLFEEYDEVGYSRSIIKYWGFDFETSITGQSSRNYAEKNILTNFNVTTRPIS